MIQRTSLTMTDRRVIQIIPGPWDAVWFDPQTRQLTIETVLFAAVCQVSQRFPEDPSRPDFFIGSEITPMLQIPAELGPLDAIDDDNYLGMVRHGDDPMSPSSGLRLPVDLIQEVTP